MQKTKGVFHWILTIGYADKGGTYLTKGSDQGSVSLQPGARNSVSWNTLFHAEGRPGAPAIQATPDINYFLLVLAFKNGDETVAGTPRSWVDSEAVIAALSTSPTPDRNSQEERWLRHELRRDYRPLLQNALYIKDMKKDNTSRASEAAARGKNQIGPLYIVAGGPGASGSKWGLCLPDEHRLELRVLPELSSVWAEIDRARPYETIALELLRKAGYVPFNRLLTRLGRMKSSENGKPSLIRGADVPLVDTADNTAGRSEATNGAAQQPEATAVPHDLSSSEPNAASSVDGRVWSVAAAIHSTAMTNYYRQRGRDGYGLYQYRVGDRFVSLPWITRPEWIALNVPLIGVRLHPDEDFYASELTPSVSRADESKARTLFDTIDADCVDARYHCGDSFLQPTLISSNEGQSLSIHFSESFLNHPHEEDALLWRHRHTPDVFVCEFLHAIHELINNDNGISIDDILHRLDANPSLMPNRARALPIPYAFSSLSSASPVVRVTCVTIAPLSSAEPDRIICSGKAELPWSPMWAFCSTRPRLDLRLDDLHALPTVGRWGGTTIEDTPDFESIIAYLFCKDLLGYGDIPPIATRRRSGPTASRYAEKVDGVRELFREEAIRTRVVCAGFSALSGCFEVGVAIYVPNREPVRRSIPWRDRFVRRWSGQRARGNLPLLLDGEWPWAIDWSKDRALRQQSALCFDPDWLESPMASEELRTSERRLEWAHGGVLPTIVETMRALPEMMGRAVELNGLSFAEPGGKTFSLHRG